jgi:LSD1 subclass zinc finger protein
MTEQPSQVARPLVPGPGMRHVQCGTCHAVAELPEGTDPHGVPCWNPSGEPDGGCGERPVTHHAVAGQVQVA